MAKKVVKKSVPVSKWNGKRFVAKMTLAETGRQADSDRAKSFKIIERAKGGVSAEEYVKAGGVLRYVPWFIERKEITAR